MSAPRLFTKGDPVRWAPFGKCIVEYGPFAQGANVAYLVKHSGTCSIARAVDLVPIPEPRWVPVPVDNFRWRPPDGTPLDLTYPGKPGYTLERMEDET